MPGKARASGLEWHVDEATWYQSTLAHWTKEVSPESNDGVLGGWAVVNEEDARGSLAFLKTCLGVPRAQWPIAGTLALDCGAGVGRVTGAVLLHVTERVQLVEVSEQLLAEARSKLAADAARCEFVQASLRDFSPPVGSYDIVWAQWVLGHLTDRDVASLLTCCRAALRPGGAVIVKDNTAPPKDCDQGGGRYLLDEENAAVIRTYTHIRALAKIAGLKLSKTQAANNPTIQNDYTSRRTTPHHTIPYHTVPYHTIPYHTIPYHTIHETAPHCTAPHLTATSRTAPDTRQHCNAPHPTTNHHPPYSIHGMASIVGTAWHGMLHLLAHGGLLLPHHTILSRTTPHQLQDHFPEDLHQVRMFYFLPI